jgi:hypothetical protein
MKKDVQHYNFRKAQRHRSGACNAPSTRPITRPNPTDIKPVEKECNELRRLALVCGPKTRDGERRFRRCAQIACRSRNTTNFILTMSFCAIDPYLATKGPAPKSVMLKSSLAPPLWSLSRNGRCRSLPLEWSEEGASLLDPLSLARPSSQQVM